MREIARLVLPSVRWDATQGFSPARLAVRRALAAGVGGFVIEAAPRDAIAELAAEIRAAAEEPPLLLIERATLEAPEWNDRPVAMPPDGAIASLRDAIDIRQAARVVAQDALRAGCSAIIGPPCGVARAPNARLFGSDPSAVSSAVVEWIDAAQAEGVLCIADSFPGTGRLDARGAGVPAVRDEEDEVFAIDLVPFRAAIDAGVAGLLIAHASYLSLDPLGTPAPLSRPIVGRLLRDQLGYEGLAVADATALARHMGKPPALADLIGSGVDLILRPWNTDVELRAMMDAISDRKLDPERVHEAARRGRAAAESAASSSRSPGITDRDRAWADDVAERTIVVRNGRNVRIATPVEVAVVGNDRDAARLAETFARGYAEAGGSVDDVRHVTVPSGSIRAPLIAIVAPGGETPGASPAESARDRVARLDALGAVADRAARDMIVVWCAPPELELGTTSGNLVIACWNASDAMIRGAARWLVRRV